MVSHFASWLCELTTINYLHIRSTELYLFSTNLQICCSNQLLSPPESIMAVYGKVRYWVLSDQGQNPYSLSKLYSINTKQLFIEMFYSKTP